MLPDDEKAAVTVTETLLAHGHRDRIALIGRNRLKEDDPEVSIAARARLRGIRKTLSAADVTLFAECHCVEWLPEHGYAAMCTLLSRSPRPTAVICMNDRLAFGAYQALNEAGLTVPDDISVISFDDDPIAAWLRPSLTSAALPHERMGRRAVELVLDGGAAGPSYVPMPLRRRRSTAAPAGTTHSPR